MLVIMFLQSVWSHFPFSSHLPWVCAGLCVCVWAAPFSGVYSVHWSQWLQCSHVCASACVCMTAALNPVTGHGMSSTEIAAEPLNPLPTVAVCVTTPREADKLTHTPSADAHTQALSVSSKTEVVTAQSLMFRLCVFVPPWWCLFYLHMREEVSAVSTLKPGSVWSPQFPRLLKAHFIFFCKPLSDTTPLFPQSAPSVLRSLIHRVAASFSLIVTHLLHVCSRITCCSVWCV